MMKAKSVLICIVLMLTVVTVLTVSFTWPTEKIAGRYLSRSGRTLLLDADGSAKLAYQRAQPPHSSVVIEGTYRIEDDLVKIGVSGSATVAGTFRIKADGNLQGNSSSNVWRKLNESSTAPCDSNVQAISHDSLATF